METRIVVMGVAGCGKSTLGEALAKRIGAGFIDGDSLHSAANVAKMSRGEPLTDEDRRPWLETIGTRLGCSETPLVIASSALKRRYRDRIAQAAEKSVLFIHLDGKMALIDARMRARRDHYMPPSLLQSQFDALEPPGSDENAFAVGIEGTPDQILAALMSRLSKHEDPPG